MAWNVFIKVRHLLEGPVYFFSEFYKDVHIITGICFIETVSLSFMAFCRYGNKNVKLCTVKAEFK